MEALPRFRSPVVTVGSFDGVHRGHLFLLDILRRRASESGGEAVVVTFGEHPRRVLGSGEGIKLLTSTEEKARLIEAAGIDDLVVMPFDERISHMSAEEFVRDFLVARLGVRELVVGYNHRLGRDREGDAAVLEELGARYGFRVFRAPKFSGDESDGEKISSTAIRNAISRGDVEAAERMLGRAVEPGR
jgi:riboflavin kinase/FMN adenylyltransferase